MPALACSARVAQLGVPEPAPPGVDDEAGAEARGDNEAGGEDATEAAPDEGAAGAAVVEADATGGAALDDAPPEVQPVAKATAVTHRAIWVRPIDPIRPILSSGLPE